MTNKNKLFKKQVTKLLDTRKNLNSQTDVNNNNNSNNSCCSSNNDGAGNGSQQQTPADCNNPTNNTTNSSNNNNTTNTNTNNQTLDNNKTVSFKNNSKTNAKDNSKFKHKNSLVTTHHRALVASGKNGRNLKTADAADLHNNVRSSSGHVLEQQQQQLQMMLQRQQQQQQEEEDSKPKVRICCSCFEKAQAIKSENVILEGLESLRRTITSQTEMICHMIEKDAFISWKVLNGVTKSKILLESTSEFLTNLLATSATQIREMLSKCSRNIQEKMQSEFNTISEVDDIDNESLGS
ncbi:hypothetical protein HELRODRAFT_171984 [Helobdella robusta]|uniref:Uncharacterized protein n=1 Tax=Helobdella robusta TaxID=6412 RepID=T1F4X0_HELRO|nr:hypothetical protein HELRODRAFT_171984 [Helobdella robusta]ESO04977.1 hypothetical protein HELRODRAFT_171984 [Helobdella robusta]